MAVTLRIASWNINSVRARLDLVTRFLREHAPDVLCLQETKASNGDFPAAFFAELGYAHQQLRGQRMHHGVAILSRVELGDAHSHDWQGNDEARHVGATLPGGIRLENVYIPAGGDIPDAALNPKFGQKMAFYDRMTSWSEKLKQPTILLGDFNIAPLPCDVWNHKHMLKVVSHTPMEVEKMEQLQQSHGWVDLGRVAVPAPERQFTWWSYRAKDWRESDRGLRLDHIWLSPELAETHVSYKVLEDVRGWEKPSDHAPIIADFTW